MNRKVQPLLEEINITPLTDIFLVLLIIMMVVAPMLNFRGLPAAFNPGSAEPGVAAANVLLVEVGADREFRVNGKATESDDLLQVLRAAADEFAGGAEIVVHPDAQLAGMVFALNAVERAGFDHVSVTARQGVPLGS
ncbi:MAG: hypothetical protein AMXMBFR4_32040 [Candidatus Hydrogenedentota bacterium]